MLGWRSWRGGSIRIMPNMSWRDNDWNTYDATIIIQITVYVIEHYR